MINENQKNKIDIILQELGGRLKNVQVREGLITALDYCWDLLQSNENKEKKDVFTEKYHQVLQNENLPICDNPFDLLNADLSANTKKSFVLGMNQIMQRFIRQGERADMKEEDINADNSIYQAADKYGILTPAEPDKDFIPDVILELGAAQGGIKNRIVGVLSWFTKKVSGIDKPTLIDIYNYEKDLQKEIQKTTVYYVSGTRDLWMHYETMAPRLLVPLFPKEQRPTLKDIKERISLLKQQIIDKNAGETLKTPEMSKRLKEAILTDRFFMPIKDKLKEHFPQEIDLMNYIGHKFAHLNFNGHPILGIVDTTTGNGRATTETSLQALVADNTFKAQIQDKKIKGENLKVLVTGTRNQEDLVRYYLEPLGITVALLSDRKEKPDTINLYAVFDDIGRNLNGLVGRWLNRQKTPNIIGSHSQGRG